MKFNLTIDLRNAAFDASPSGELATILRELASIIAKDGIIDVGTLTDINGNAVGHWTVNPLEPACTCSVPPGDLLPAGPTFSQVEFALRVCPNHHAMTPEKELDPEAADRIRHRINKGDPWAWCAVEVKAYWTNPNGRRFEGVSFTPACSFVDWEDFRSRAYAEAKQLAYRNLLSNVR
jgi:hypothetical protein